MFLTTFEAEIQMRKWASERHRRGLKIPASAQRPSNPALRIIAEETGISRLRFDRKGQHLREVLEELISRYGLGLEWDGERFESAEIHLHLARSLAMDHYARECHDASTYFDPVRQLLDRLFNILIKRSGGDPAAPAEKAVKAFCGDIKRNAVRDGDAYVPYLETILALIEYEKSLTSLPEDFASRLRLLLGRAGLPRSRAAAMVGVNQGTFNSWCSGEKSPDRSAWPAIEELENKLKLDAGTLVGLIKPGQKGKGRFRAELFPQSLRTADKANLRSEIGRQMPSDFFERPVGEQMLLLAAKGKEIEGNLKRRRAWYAVRQDSYALEDYPPALKADVEALFRFKAEGDPFIDHNGKLVFPHTIWKTADTRQTMDKRLRAYFGYLIHRAPLEQRISEEDASLVHLLDVAAIAGYLRFKAERQMEVNGAPRLTPTDMDLVTFAAALVSEADGFIRHHPMFLAPVLKVFGKTPPAKDEERRHEMLEFARHCGLAYDNLKRLEKSYRGKTSNSEKHQARMKPLLSVERPLALVYERLEGLEAEISRLRVGSFAYWQSARTIALVHFLAQLPFRANTLVALDFRHDNTGHLRRVDGGWGVVVPVNLFKNSDSRRFSDGKEFEKKFEDVNGAYKAMSRYVLEARPHILKGTQSDALFVATPQYPRYSEQRLANLVYRTTDRMFGKSAEDGQRIEGLEAFTSHGFRDILATAVLKATGRYELAADAIQDAPSTVQTRYAQWRPSDRKDDLQSALRVARFRP